MTIEELTLQKILATVESYQELIPKMKVVIHIDSEQQYPELFRELQTPMSKGGVLAELPVLIFIGNEQPENSNSTIQPSKSLKQGAKMRFEQHIWDTPFKHNQLVHCSNRFELLKFCIPSRETMPSTIFAFRTFEPKFFSIFV